MGHKTATETLAKILSILLEERRIRQSELASRVGISDETLRRQFDKMLESGFPIEKTVVGRAVEWSVPEGWFPNGVLFEGENARSLLRLLLRLSPSKERDEALQRVANAAMSAKEVRSLEAVIEPPRTEKNSREMTSHLEDAAANKSALWVRYKSGTHPDGAWKLLSVQRVRHGAKTRLVAWDHGLQALRWYRLDRVEQVGDATGTDYVQRPEEEVARFDEESINGYREGELLAVAFVVARTTWAWVQNNLPLEECEKTDLGAQGVRVTAQTRGVSVLARYLVGLGAGVQIETPELRTRVRAIAEDALRAHREATIVPSAHEQNVERAEEK